ncbi:MAG: FAD-dependent oxidoreductase [Thermoplasmatales archaeon]|nr:FAD-dependent oxidoreductase [Thermoplasmatales archaeon]MCW6170592.1 FAD-dependent oxidoreductase [Thermoplasmatales archaeon]
MSEFDVIVVGAGPAGSSAAIKLASEKMNVLLVDRADPPGSKNISGGVLWGNDLENILPGWNKMAPVERYITSKGVGFLTKDSSIDVNIKSRKFLQGITGYSVLRVKFDQFLAKRAESAGAMLVSGVTVENLAFKDGKVIGVVQEGDTITADTVILAEGANPRVAIDSGARRPIADQDVAIGIKEVVKLPEATINERFGLTSKEGFAGEYALGFLEDGVEAGGFLYTNRESISLGVVINMGHLRADDKTYSFDIMDQFTEHPSIASLIQNGKLSEYSAHLVVEGGYNSFPKQYGNGYMIVGDAAGLSFSNGLMIQGMNYAIASGILAAETAIEAKKSSDFSEKSFSRYKDKMMESFVAKDAYNFKGIEEVTWGKLAHKIMPSLMEDVLVNMFLTDSTPKKHLTELIRKAMKENNVKSSDLLMEGYKMIRRM